MTKFKTGLVKQFNEEQQVDDRQRQLRSKFDIENPEVVVVEKSNMVKFTITTLGTIMRVVASILLCSLAIVGLIAILYPGTREGLINIWRETVLMVQQYFA